jgi:hypothetical protein
VGVERPSGVPRTPPLLLLAALAAAGCAGRDGATLGADQHAVLEAEEGTVIEAVDGAMAARMFQGAPVEISAGRHTIRLRRRFEVPPGTRAAPAPAFKVASDPNATAAYVTDSTCTLVFDARAGARYAARTSGDPRDETWIGSIVGPDIDLRCTARDAVADGLVGQTRYLCCTMVFDDGQATDANYRYEGPSASRLPAGTPVVVTDAGRNRLSFRAAAGGQTYELYFEYGLAHADAEAYFSDILRESDPAVELRGAPATIADAVAGARLIPGMTREQAIMARGYPPLHRTPDRSGSEWLYYDAPGVGVYVTFADGEIRSVRNGEAP